MNIKSFTELVSDQVTAIQARSSKLVDFTIGSILLSLAESNAGVAMWIQQLIVKLLVTTRAATCSGEDLDSWMADFRFSRLSAVQATGSVTFQRFTSTTKAIVLPGTRVTTLDGAQTYSVIADEKRETWDAGQAGYVLKAGVSSLSVPVRADTAGQAGNAQKNCVTVISGAVPFVDTVMNPEAFMNGKDAESDDDYRARFVLWIASLSKATKAAIGFVISNIPEVVSYTLTENVDEKGDAKPGYFFAVIDDGSGQPSDTLLEKVRAAIDAVRGFTITFGVSRPEVLKADVILRVETEAHADAAEIKRKVKLALEAFISKLPLGQLLAYTQLVRVAYGASPLVVNVTALKLNNGIADMSATGREVIRPGDITVS